MPQPPIHKFPTVIIHQQYITIIITTTYIYAYQNHDCNIYVCIRIYAYSYYTIPSPYLPAALVPICMLSLQADDEASEGVKDEELPSENSEFSGWYQYKC